MITARIPRQRRVRRTLSVVLVAALAAGCSSAASSASPATPSTPHGSPGSRSGFVISLQAVGTKDTALVQVAGGPWTRVIVDTGSSGLVIDRAKLGPDYRATGQSVQRRYGYRDRSRTIAGSVVLATVSVSDGSTLTTPQIPVAAFDPTAPSMASGQDGIYGILGIGPNIITGSAGVESPLAQLPAPYSEGFTFVARASGLQLGPPSLTAKTASVHMTPATTHFPNGLRSWSKSITVCWTIAQTRRCVPSVVDSGGNQGTVSSTLFADAPHSGSHLTSGTAVTLSTPGGAVLADVQPNDAAAINYTVAPTMNTGVLPLRANDVGVNLVTGVVSFTPSA